MASKNRPGREKKKKPLEKEASFKEQLMDKFPHLGEKTPKHVTDNMVAERDPTPSERMITAMIYGKAS